MKKSSICPLLALLLFAGCQDSGGLGPVDAQKFLSGLEGPKVPSMQDELTESAQDAEKKGDFKQAAMLYRQILEKHPDNKDVMVALADCYRRSGDFDQSIAIYDGLLKADPTMISAKEGKGLALVAKGDFETPTKLFEEILQKDKTRWKTLNALGILFTTRNMQSEAQQYFKEALKYHPDSPSILNNMGLSQALDHHYNDAIETLNKASGLSTVDSMQRARVDLNLALVYAIDGKLDEAHAIAQNYYSGAALDNNLGLYAHLAKDDQMAKTYLNMALTESKTFYEKAWNNLQEISSDSADNDPKELKVRKPAKKVKAENAAPPAPTPSDSVPANPQ